MELEKSETREDAENLSTKSISLKKRSTALLETIRVEPIVILFSLGFAFINIQMPTLYVQKTCKVGSYFWGNQTFSHEICDNLFNGSFDAEQAIVQKVDSKVQIVAQILNNVPMAIFALFLGPWSDSVGRKMLIIIPLIGSILLCLIYVINVFFFDELVVEFLWFESLSYCLGCYSVFFLGCYGYIVDTTSVKSRTIRFSVMEGLFAVAEGLGNFINVYLYSAFKSFGKNCGYYGNFGTAAVLFLLAIGIAQVRIQDKKEKKNEKIRVFDWRNVLESFKVLVKKRPNNLMHIVIILLVCYQISFFCFNGLTHVDYLYMRRKFDFPSEDDLIGFYTHLLSYKSIINTFSMLIILPIAVKTFKFSDMSLTMISFTACIIKVLIYCFAENKNVLYAVLAVAVFDQLFNMPLRSSMSKIVGSGEVGKVFAAMGSIKALTGFAAPVFNYIYIQTLDTYVGSVFLVMAALYTINIALTLYVWVVLRKVK